jgi:hypothetical protein
MVAGSDGRDTLVTAASEGGASRIVGGGTGGFIGRKEENAA